MTPSEVLPLRWTVSFGGLVRGAGPFGERAAINPTGGLIAWLPRRTRPVGIAERERVRVSSVETGEVVAAMPGPAIVRTLHWLGENRLVIARDARGGMLLQLVEVPPGEVLAEAFLPGRSEQRFTMSHTPDGRTLCAVEQRAQFEGPCAVWRIDGETLAPRGAVLSVEPGRTVRLHPDGHRILYTEEVFRSYARTAWVARVVPSEAPAWEVTQPVDDDVTFVWSGRDHVLARVAPLSRRRSPLPRDTPRVAWYEIDVACGVARRSGKIPRGQSALIPVSPTGARIAVVQLDLGAQESETEPSLNVVSHPVLQGGAPERASVGFPRSFTSGTVNVVWTPDGAGLIFVLSFVGGTLFATPRGDGTMRAFVNDARVRWWNSTVELCGRHIVEHHDDDHTVWLTDLAALV